MLEPYRPYVDWRVFGMVRDGVAVDELGRAEKQALLSLFNEIVTVGALKTPLLLAMQHGASSLALAFAEGEADLKLPEGLPLRPPAEANDAGPA